MLGKGVEEYLEGVKCFLLCFIELPILLPTHDGVSTFWLISHNKYYLHVNFCINCTTKC